MVKKPINPEYYKTIEILGLPETNSPKYLTKKEYLEGKPGLVLLGENGIIFWKDRCNEIHLHRK